MFMINNDQAQNVFLVSGAGYSFNSNQKETPRLAIEKRRTIQEILQSTEPVNQRYFSKISMYLVKGWQDVMRNLKFSEAQIHQFMVDFYIYGGLKEVIYQLLLDWSQNEEKTPTLGEITTILWKNGHKETVRHVNKLYIRNSEKKVEVMA